MQSGAEDAGTTAQVITLGKLREIRDQACLLTAACPGWSRARPSPGPGLGRGRPQTRTSQCGAAMTSDPSDLEALASCAAADAHPPCLQPGPQTVPGAPSSRTHPAAMRVAGN